MNWDLTADELELTRNKINAINVKAAKRGLSGRLEVVSEKIEISRDIAGIEIKEIVYRTSVQGEPPKHNGWSFLASLEWIETGVIVSNVPGAPMIDRSKLEPNKCDHCGYYRNRKATYVVSDGNRQLQVGSTCMKDFLGWDGSVVLITEKDIEQEIGGFYGTGSRDFLTESVLAVAWACVTELGYVRSSEPGATRDAVAAVLSPVVTKWNREIKERIGPIAGQAVPMAQRLREFILSDEFWGNSDYVLNLKTMCAAETAQARHLGFLASVPQAYAKHLERSFIKQRASEALANEWVGTEKEKLTLNVKIRAIRWIQDDFNPYGGSKPLYTFLSDTGHTFKWFASRAAFGEEVTPEDGEFFSIQGSVKKHEDYKGLKSTVLTRCKKV